MATDTTIEKELENLWTDKPNNLPTTKVVSFGINETETVINWKNRTVQKALFKRIKTFTSSRGYLIQQSETEKVYSIRIVDDSGEVIGGPWAGPVSNKGKTLMNVLKNILITEKQSDKPDFSNEEDLVGVSGSNVPTPEWKPFISM